jgi:predicted amino acid-binding ACT domain protein
VRVEVHAADRSGLLSDFTRVLREHGLSLLRVELKRHRDEAFGVFYLDTDTGGEVRTEALRAVQMRVAEMGISLDVVKETKAPGWPPVRKTSVPAPPVAGQQPQEKPRPSLGSLLWSNLEKLSNNFNYIRSPA